MDAQEGREEIKEKEQVDLLEAVRLALNEVIGAYAIVILSKNDPNTLIAARKGSPLVVGISDTPGEFYLASDASPIVEYTKTVTYLNDNEIVSIHNGEMTLKTIDNVAISPYIQELKISLDAIEKGGYEHFMLKEIFEQPKSIYDSMRGRFDPINLAFSMRSLEEYASIFF